MVETPKLPCAGHIYLVDDDELIRGSLCAVLKSHNFEVQEFGSTTEFLQHHKPVTPAVMLLDVQLPDESGIELQKKLKFIAPTLSIIFITGQCKNTDIVQGIKAGAIDFLFKPFGVDALMNAVSDALAHSHQQTIDLQSQKTILKRYDTLTAREKEVCRLIAAGLKNLEIASHLEIAPATVKIHKSKVFEKMGVNSVVALITLLEVGKLN